MELLCVDPSKVREMWPHVAPIFHAEIERTKRGSIADLEREVLAGNGLVWVAWDGSEIKAAAATVLVKEDAGLVCLIMSCAGTDMLLWVPLLGGIETYAAAEGCKRVRIVGRKGWLKMLDGYRAEGVVMDKEIG